MIPGKNKKGIIAIIILDLVLATVLGWSCLETIHLAEQNAQMSAQISEFENRRQNFSKVRSETDDLKMTLDVLNSYLIPSDQRVLLIDTLEDLGRLAGIKYELNNASEGERLSLDANLSGSFVDIFHFLKLAESSGYWLTYEKLSLLRAAGGKGGWSGSLVVNIPSVVK